MRFVCDYLHLLVAPVSNVPTAPAPSQPMLKVLVFAVSPELHTFVPSLFTPNLGNLAVSLGTMWMLVRAKGSPVKQRYVGSYGTEPWEVSAAPSEKTPKSVRTVGSKAAVAVTSPRAFLTWHSLNPVITAC